MSHDAEGFKNLSIEEQLKTMIEYLDIFLTGASENERASFVMNILQKMMGNELSMKNMPQMMGSMFSMMGGNMFKDGWNNAPFGGERNISINATPEIKALFDEWVRQVREEIDAFTKDNKDAAAKDIAQYLKISEESLKYFNKDLPGAEPPR